MIGAPQTCDRCPTLVEGRKQVVNSRGAGRRVVFVGQGPGQTEDEQGKCFVGPSGHILGALLRLAEIPTEHAWFTNSIRCLTPGNRAPKKDEIDNCSPFLLEEIEEKKPELIVALGAVALQSLYGAVPLGTVAGQTLDHRGTPLIATFHPAAVMRNWALAPLVLAHFQKVKRLLDGTQQEEGLGEYHTVKTLQGLRALKEVLDSPEQGFVSIDSETSGLSWMEDELLTITFSPAPNIGYTVPVLGKGTQSFDFWRGCYPEVIKIVGEILSSPVPKALQNAGFDVRFLERSADQPWISAATAFGWRVENLKHDSMLLHKALHEEMPKEAKPNELSRLVGFYTGMPAYSETVRGQSKNKTRMEEAEDEDLWQMGAADADAVSRIVTKLRAEVDEEGMGWVMDNITIPMVRVCQEMTVRGVLVDRPYFDRLSAYYADQIKEAEMEIHLIAETTPETFNLGSNQQLQKILHEKLGLPKTGRKTKASRECQACQEGECEKHDATDKDALGELYSLTKHLFIEAFLRWRSLVKIKGTYLDGSGKNGELGGFAAHIRPDGRLHPSFKVGGAETGRLSASDPAIQTPPKNVVIEEWGLGDAFRRCFVAPEGSVVMEADWSQLEVWVNAYLADDQDFLELLMSGQDVHTHVGRKIAWPGYTFPIDPDLNDTEWKEKYDELRRRAKDINFGAQYALTVAGLQERMNVNEDEAESILGYYFNLRPRLKDFIDQRQASILQGEPVLTPFGRRFHFPQIPILRAAQKGAGKQMWRICQNEIESVVREGINRDTQSSGSDLHSLAHIWTEHTPILEGRFRPNLAVHDSVVGEAHAPDQDFVIETAWKIKENWQRIAKDTVLPNGKMIGWEIPVEVKFGESWGTMSSRLSPKGELYLEEVPVPQS